MLLDIVEKKIEPNITLIELFGKLALGREGQRIEAMVESLAKQGNSRVVFDMTNVDYIDSAGVGLLALAAGKLKEAGGKLVVVAPEGRVRQLLNLTQVASIVALCGTVAEATAAFGQTQPPAAA